MRKNSQGRILKGELKEQHLSTISKSCSIFITQCLQIDNFTINVNSKFKKKKKNSMVIMFEYEPRKQFGSVSNDTIFVEMVTHVHFWAHVTI